MDMTWDMDIMESKMGISSCGIKNLNSGKMT